MATRHNIDSTRRCVTTGTIIFSRTNILKGFIIVHTLSPDDAGANDGSLDVKIMRRNCSDHGGSSRWLDLGLLFQVVVVVVFLLLGPGGGAEPRKQQLPPSMTQYRPVARVTPVRGQFEGRRRHRPLVASSADAMMARIDDG